MHQETLLQPRSAVLPHDKRIAIRKSEEKNKSQQKMGVTEEYTKL